MAVVPTDPAPREMLKAKRILSSTEYCSRAPTAAQIERMASAFDRADLRAVIADKKSSKPRIKAAGTKVAEKEGSMIRFFDSHSSEIFS